MRLSFTLNDTQVNKTLSDLAKGVKNFSKPFKKSAEKLLPFFSEGVFESQGKAVGESWRRLAESTLRARAARSGYYKRPPITTGKILIWTGRLKGGFKSEINPAHLRIFNVTPYFKYHQMGQRRMLAINSFVIEAVTREFNKYIASLL